MKVRKEVKWAQNEKVGIKKKKMRALLLSNRNRIQYQQNSINKKWNGLEQSKNEKLSKK